MIKDEIWGGDYLVRGNDTFVCRLNNVASGAAPGERSDKIIGLFKEREELKLAFDRFEHESSFPGFRIGTTDLLELLLKKEQTIKLREKLYTCRETLMADTSFVDQRIGLFVDVGYAALSTFEVSHPIYKPLRDNWLAAQSTLDGIEQIFYRYVPTKFVLTRGGVGFVQRHKSGRVVATAASLSIFALRFISSLYALEVLSGGFFVPLRSLVTLGVKNRFKIEEKARESFEDAEYFGMDGASIEHQLAVLWAFYGGSFSSEMRRTPVANSQQNPRYLKSMRSEVPEAWETSEKGEK